MKYLPAFFLIFASACDGPVSPDAGSTLQCVEGIEPQSFPDFSPCMFSPIDYDNIFVFDEGTQFAYIEAEVSAATIVDNALESSVFETDALGFCDRIQFNRLCSEGTVLQLELNLGPLFLCYPTMLDLDSEQLVAPLDIKIQADVTLTTTVDVNLTRSGEPILISSGPFTSLRGGNWADETAILVSPYFEIDSISPESHCAHVDCGDIRDLNYRVTVGETTTDIASGESLRIENKVFRAGVYRIRTEWSCSDAFNEAAWVFYAANPE